MPLNKEGENVKGRFENEYGETKGKKIFYAKENKDKKFAHIMTKVLKKTK